MLSKGSESESFEGWTPEDHAFYSHALGAFVSGGAKAVEASAPDRWLQIAVATEDSAADLLTGPLATRVEDWLARGAIQDFFFMRKSPGIRLRFFCRDLTAQFQEDVFVFFEAERVRGAITSYAPGVYDSEIYQFGGVAGLELMHQHATYDSLVALRLLQREKSGVLKADLPFCSLLFVNDLIRRVVEGRWEAWDVWENMRLAGRVIEDADIDPVDLQELKEATDQRRDLLLGTLTSADDLCARLDPEERDIAMKYFSGNSEWADRCHEVIARGELFYGIRKILPFYIAFHWNRLGFDLDEQCTLVFQMRRILNPKNAT